MKKTRGRLLSASKKQRTTKKNRGGSKEKDYSDIKCLHQDDDCLINPNYPEIKFFNENNKVRNEKLGLLSKLKTPKEFHKIMNQRYPKSEFKRYSASRYSVSGIDSPIEEDEEYEMESHPDYQELTAKEQEFEKNVLYKEPQYKCYKPNKLAKSKLFSMFTNTGISTLTKNALKQLNKINPDALDYYWHHCSILRHLYNEYHKEIYSKKSRSNRWFSLYGRSQEFAQFLDAYYNDNKKCLHKISEEYNELMTPFGK